MMARFKWYMDPLSPHINKTKCQLFCKMLVMGDNYVYEISCG